MVSFQKCKQCGSWRYKGEECPCMRPKMTSPNAPSAIALVPGNAMLTGAA